jgi:aspartate kinase
VNLIVQKYGGSSLADADGIKRVAQRIVATRKAGHGVIVVVSAMGDTTDELHDLALEISPLPSASQWRSLRWPSAISDSKPALSPVRRPG